MTANLPSFPNIALRASRAFRPSWSGRAEQTRRFWSDIAGWSDRALLALGANPKRAGRADFAPGFDTSKWAFGAQRSLRSEFAPSPVGTFWPRWAFGVCVALITAGGAGESSCEIRAFGFFRSSPDKGDRTARHRQQSQNGQSDQDQTS